MSVALVTDSTASLSGRAGRHARDHRGAAAGRHRCHVVRRGRREAGHAADPGRRAQGWTAGQHLAAQPGGILETYEKLAGDGAEAIVSVHIPAELSGTFESAQLAARRRIDPGDAGGLAAGRHGHRLRRLAAAEAIAGGADARERRGGRPDQGREHHVAVLRRHARVPPSRRPDGCRAALLGSALAVKPILKVEDGRIGPFEKVRTVGEGAVPARGARGGGGARTPTWTSRSHTWPVPTGPRSWPSGSRATRGRAGRSRVVGRRDRRGARRARRTRHGRRRGLDGAADRPHLAAAAVVHRPATRASRRRVRFLASWHAQAVTDEVAAAARRRLELLGASSTRQGCGGSTTSGRTPSHRERACAGAVDGGARRAARPCLAPGGTRRLGGWLRRPGPGDPARAHRAGTGPGAAGGRPGRAGGGATASWCSRTAVTPRPCPPPERSPARLSSRRLVPSARRPPARARERVRT